MQPVLPYSAILILKIVTTGASHALRGFTAAPTTSNLPIALTESPAAAPPRLLTATYLEVSSHRTNVSTTVAATMKKSAAPITVWRQKCACHLLITAYLVMATVIARAKATTKSCHQFIFFCGTTKIASAKAHHILQTRELQYIFFLIYIIQRAA